MLDVTVLKGREFDLIEALAAYYRDDTAAGRRLADYQYARPDQLADDLTSGVEVLAVETVRQLVKRVRQDVAEALANMEEPPAKDVLIQTGVRGRGYRLNPRVRLVTP